MIDLATVVQDVANVGDSEAKLLNSDRRFLEGAIPETAHGVLVVLLDGVVRLYAVSDISHTMEVESADKETLNQVSNFVFTVIVVSHGDSGHQCTGKCFVHR